MKFETTNAIIEVDDSPAVIANVFKRVIEFYEKHESFNGESVFQNDGPSIEASEFMSTLADELNFKVIWKI